MAKLHRAWYYDWTEDQRYAQDPMGESNIAWLCDGCARTLTKAGLVSHASEDDLTEQPCWLCGRVYPDDTPSDDFFDLLPRAAPDGGLTR